MRHSKRPPLGWGMGVAIATVVVTLGWAHQLLKQTLAPHELNNSDAPPAIIWETPAVPDDSVNFESAEERHLRVVVITKGLQQPWSLAFLPGGEMLVTERSGRLRIVRNGNLVRSPVAGVPPIQTGGPRGLQGLMDIALHPQFNKNKWIYLAYHKPAGGGAGETVLARGTWNGTALVDLHNIFESGATETEASRITFGRDGMLYMSISAPGSPSVQRSQDTNDYAGKTVRLRDDGSIPDDNPFIGRAGFKPGIFTSGHRNGHGLAVNPEPVNSGRRNRGRAAETRSMCFAPDVIMDGRS
jgi:glucose/arabinose dehydrogenase